jgi:hypothetical protein
MWGVGAMGAEHVFGAVKHGGKVPAFVWWHMGVVLLNMEDRWWHCMVGYSDMP